MTNIEILKNSFEDIYKSSFNVDEHSLVEKSIIDIFSFNYDDAEFNELFSTAIIAIQEVNLKAKAICALFLFKAVAEEKLTKTTILKEYGEKVLIIVEGLIKIHKIDTKTSNLKSENFIKLLLSQADDVRVVLLLIVQKLYLVRVVKELKEQERLQLCEELSALYAPLAHRLGLYNIKTEMEEQSMKYLHNDAYKSIATKLSETKRDRDTYINSFIAPIKEALDSKGFKYTIKGRPKSIHSIWNKIKNNNVKFESIYDLFAIRIILDSLPENEKADCWGVYSVVSDIYRPNPNRLRDWISAPKLSGYESLHTTVLGAQNKWVEIQIRTERMDEIAEKGHAAHWKYKEGSTAVGSTSWLGKVRNALENPEMSDIEESASKIELYSEEIFVFTPKGDLKRLPKGSTLLDFAYEVHTNMGSTCTGGKVNGKIVPIKHILENGDQVEILSSKSQTPKRDWLSFVQSSKARSKIKKYLLECEHKNAEEGKEIIIRKLNQIKVKFDDESVFKMIKHFGVKNALELYLKAVNEKMDWSELKPLFFPDKKDDDKRPSTIDTENFSKNITKKINSNDNYLVLDNQIDNIDFRLGKCCMPIKGDEIFGFLTASGGVTIHRLNCPNAIDLLKRYPYRVVKTRWSEQLDNESNFLAGVKVIGTDEIGIISTITQVVSQDLKVKMRDIKIVSNDNTFEGEISIYIKDIKHLDQLLKKIRAIKGVHTAERFSK